MMTITFVNLILTISIEIHKCNQYMLNIWRKYRYLESKERLNVFKYDIIKILNMEKHKCNHCALNVGERARD